VGRSEGQFKKWALIGGVESAARAVGDGCSGQEEKEITIEALKRVALSHAEFSAI